MIFSDTPQRTYQQTTTRHVLISNTPSVLEIHGHANSRKLLISRRSFAKSNNEKSQHTKVRHSVTMEFRNETNELTSRTPRSDSLLCRGTVLAILISAAVCLYRKWFIFSLSDPVDSEKLSHPACQMRPSHRRSSFFTTDTTTRLGS